MGSPTVAVYSDCDRDARHVRDADEAFHIGPSDAARELPPHRRICSTPRAVRRRRRASRLRVPRRERRVRRARARDAGLTFIGPSPDAIALMGSKTAARERRCAPACRSCRGPSSRSAQRRRGRRTSRGRPRGIGYPLMVKAVAGGGGKGMRDVDGRGAICCGAVRTARSEAGRRSATRPSISSGGIVRPAAHRDPAARRSARRRSSRSSSASARSSAATRRWSRNRRRWRSTPRLRERIAAAAAAVARAVGYTNAGTIEFLLDEDGCVLLPRDEHAPAGRAPGDRDGDGRRPRAVADPHRARRAAHDRSGARAHAARPRDRVPHLRRGSRHGFMPSPGLVRASAPAVGPGVRDDGGVTCRATRCRSSTTR